MYHWLCRYIFSTEGHLLPATPQIALVEEHCLYFGAFCNGSTTRGYGNGDSSSKQRSSNYTQFDDRQTASSQYSMSNGLFATRGYIKVCSTAFLIGNFLRHCLWLTESKGDDNRLCRLGDFSLTIYWLFAWDIPTVIATGPSLMTGRWDWQQCNVNFILVVWSTIHAFCVNLMLRLLCKDEWLC
jgi:hypothetical protein